MLYQIYYKDGSRKTIISFERLTIEEIEAQVRKRIDLDEIESFGVSPENTKEEKGE